MSRIPKKVTVGGIEYTVILQPITKIENRGTAHPDAMGITDPDARVIYLEKDRTDIDWVFLHEIIHACVDCLDITFKGAAEEKFVRPFSRLLYDALISAGLMHKAQKRYGSNRPPAKKSVGKLRRSAPSPDYSCNRVTGNRKGPSHCV